MPRKKTKKIYMAEDIFNAIPDDFEEVRENKVNNINKIKNNKEPELEPECAAVDLCGEISYCDDEVRERYICSEILDQGLMFIVNDGDKNFAKCMIVLPEYSNIIGENQYLNPEKKYTYVLNNELNLKTMKRRVSARVVDTDEFEAETGIDVSKYFKTKDNIELFADELSEHLNLIKQCRSKETARTVVLEIMRRAMHP